MRSQSHEDGVKKSILGREKIAKPEVQVWLISFEIQRDQCSWNLPHRRREAGDEVSEGGWDQSGPVFQAKGRKMDFTGLELQTETIEVGAGWGASNGPGPPGGWTSANDLLQQFDCYSVSKTEASTSNSRPKCITEVWRQSVSATPWTGAHQGPLSMEFSRQEYWSG